MKAVLVFVEGSQDVAFVERSLRALGACRRLDKAISKLPSPFGMGRTARTKMSGGCLLLQRLKDYELKDPSLTEAADLPRPSFQAALENTKSRTIFFLVRTDGKFRTETVGKERRILTADLLRQVSVAFSPNLRDRHDINQYAIAFLFDADEEGVEATLTTFRKWYTDHCGNLSAARHGTWLTETQVPVGCFVFHRADDRKGTLEDHLERMAKNAWPRMYEAASSFIEDNCCPKDTSSADNAKRVKAAITVSGQCDHPGAPMATMIQKRLHQEHFHKSALSRDLAAFLSNAPWKERGNA